MHRYIDEYVCDKCGRDHLESEDISSIEITINGDVYSDDSDMHLCGDCKPRFKAIISQFLGK